MIHSEHPFVPGPEEREPGRRFRGRLAAPVTIVTAGSQGRRAGLTVSSLLVQEGDPLQILAVVGPTSDLWDTIGETGRFIVHICGYRHRDLSEIFAGLRPSPGGPFASVETPQSDWGPVISSLPDRAYCTVVSQTEQGSSGLVVGRVDDIEVSDLTDPLVHFRGGYHRLD